MPTRRCPHCSDVHECREHFQNTSSVPPPGPLMSSSFSIRPPKHYMGDLSKKRMLGYVTKGVSLRKQDHIKPGGNIKHTQHVITSKSSKEEPQLPPPEPLPIHSPEKQLSHPTVIEQEAVPTIEPPPQLPMQLDPTVDYSDMLIDSDQLDKELRKTFPREATPTYPVESAVEEQEPAQKPKSENGDARKKKKWTNYAKEKPWEKTSFEGEASDQ